MRERSTGSTKLPIMYRRQPEYVDNNRQHFSDPDDDCAPTVSAVSQKPPKGKRLRKNRAGMLLGINLIFLGVVVYFVQTGLTSNNGVLERDGMKYQVHAKYQGSFILVTAVVTQTGDTSTLSAQRLDADFSLIKASDGLSVETPLALQAGMPSSKNQSQVLQSSIDLPQSWNAERNQDYRVRAGFRAGQSDLVIKTTIEGQ